MEYQKVEKKRIKFFINIYKHYMNKNIKGIAIYKKGINKNYTGIKKR